MGELVEIWRKILATAKILMYSEREIVYERCFLVIAYLYCRTRILIPNPVPTLQYVKAFHIAQTQIKILIPTVPIFWADIHHPAHDPSLSGNVKSH